MSYLQEYDNYEYMGKQGAGAYGENGKFSETGYTFVKWKRYENKERQPMKVYISYQAWLL